MSNRTSCFDCCSSSNKGRNAAAVPLMLRNGISWNGKGNGGNGMQFNYSGQQPGEGSRPPVSSPLHQKFLCLTSQKKKIKCYSCKILLNEAISSDKQTCLELDFFYKGVVGICNAGLLKFLKITLEYLTSVQSA